MFSSCLSVIVVLFLGCVVTGVLLACLCYYYNIVEGFRSFDWAQVVRQLQYFSTSNLFAVLSV